MTIMAYRGIMSGCWILTEEEYTSLREMAFQAEGDRVGDLAAKAEAAAALAEARADAAHWRAEHDRVCQALDAANVRADKAEAEERICQMDRGDGWGRYHDAQTEIKMLRMTNAGLVGGQRSLMQERDEARNACERLAVDLSRARLATEQEEAKVTRVMAAAIERDKEVAQLRSANAALTDQVTQARYELLEALGRPPQPPPPHGAVPLVVSVRVRYLWPAPGQAEAGTEAQGEAHRPEARRVPLHAVRPDERRE